MRTVLNDLKYSLRFLRQSPSFTITALLVLALGIGANTAIFTVIDAVVLRRLPYPDASRIVKIGRRNSDDVAEPVFAYWLRNTSGVELLSACRAGSSMNMSGGDRPELVIQVAASNNYFRLLGAIPILGRTFAESEDAPGGPRVSLISAGLWQRRFAGDPKIVGKTVELGGAPYIIVGVLSPAFRPYPAADVWTPLEANANSTNQASVLRVLGRVPRDGTLAQVRTEVRAVSKRYAETRSNRFLDPNIDVEFLQQQMTGNVRSPLFVLLGAVGLVLLMACANVANLLLGRATGRRKEMAIRAALGAGNGRIIRQLMTESGLLALGGGALGLFVGWGVLRAILSFLPNDLPRLSELTTATAFDPRVAAFTFVLALLTGLLFGLVPALDLTRAELVTSLRESGAGNGASLRQNRARGLLVASEVAIAVVLLCGAVLLIRSFVALHRVDPGFDTRDLLTTEVSLAGSGFAQSSTVERVSRKVIDSVEGITGVESVAMASALPLEGKIDMIFNIPGQPPPPGRFFSGDVQWRLVSAHYFDVLRVPLLAGRLWRDRETRRTVVISQTMARKFWPAANPVGRAIFIGPALGPEYQVGLTEIVGVVGDVHERLDTDAQPVMYQMPAQIPDADMALINSYETAAVLVRTRAGVPSSSVAPAVRQVLAANVQLPTANTRTMDRVSLDSTAQRNFEVLLLAVFAGLAVLLASAGIYGVMSYSVEQRTHEIGIRAALGAQSRDTLLLILRQALRMAIAGVIIGLAAAFELTRFLGAELFGVKSSDPFTFAAVPLILVTVALAAAWIPALRAVRVDPLTALRHE